VAKWGLCPENSFLRIATWNLNNRIGKRRFRPEAADAAVALDVDMLVFTEFFPPHVECSFRRTLECAGWRWQLVSVEPTVIANRVLIASRLPLRAIQLELPAFDEEFAPNILAVSCRGLSIVGVRIPAYNSGKLLLQAWNWLESTATTIEKCPAVILGDLNVGITTRSNPGNALRRMLANGWRRVAPLKAPTFFGYREIKTEIDHILVTQECDTCDPACILEAGGLTLAGAAHAVSDHAALTCDVQVRQVSHN